MDKAGERADRGLLSLQRLSRASSRPISEAMKSDRHSRDLIFRFSRSGEDHSSVPASVLMQTLDGAQRAIWLLAFAKEQKDIRSRVRIPADIEQRYQLKCQVPQPGSYLMPMFLDSAQPNLANWDRREAVLNDFESFAAALHSQDRDSIATLLPDSGLRKRVVDAFLRIAPKPGSGWLLDLARNGTALRLDDRWQRLVRKMFASATPEPDRETVNGELMEIDFADRLITITPIGLSTTRAQVAFTSIPLVGRNDKLAEYSGHERHHRKNPGLARRYPERHTQNHTPQGPAALRAPPEHSAKKIFPVSAKSQRIPGSQSQTPPGTDFHCGYQN